MLQKSISYIFILVWFLGCNLNNKIHGKYVLINPNDENIAEILELNIDSSFIFSGLINEDSTMMTWVIEGDWINNRDSIILNSKHYDSHYYGSSINIKYLSEYITSSAKIDQAVIVCKDLILTVKNQELNLIKKDIKLVYSKIK